MKVYLVGGAVRDRLLGLQSIERDWVVVGSTTEAMLKAGYKQVGKSFPVFLHPETHDEYALARTERKTEKGYYGFECDFSPTVTLEQDLMRRDFTMNAIAMDENDNLIDPFNGQADLKAKIIRHVSAAFSEDPVRIIRGARFMARFAPLGFTLALETIALMQHMVELGEVDALIPERIWKEMVRALSDVAPVAFIRTLRQCTALQRIMPELDRLYGVPQRPEYHPEVDTGIHTEMVLEVATQISTNPAVRFAALMHDLGKGTTPKDMLPRHIGHEERSVKLVRALSERLKVPTDFKELAVLVARHHGQIHRAKEMRADTLVSFFEKVDAFRRPQRFEEILLACQADSQGRTGFESRFYESTPYLQQTLAAAQAVEVSQIPYIKDKPGDVIKQMIHKARTEAVRNVIKESSSETGEENKKQIQ